jgi:hypothetical protein
MHLWPKESVGPHFCLGPKMALVSTVLRGVTLSQNLLLLFFWYTSSHNSIVPKFEEIRRIPKIFSVFRNYLNCSNDINHPSIFVEYSVEVVISHLILYGLFIILSTVHPRQVIGYNISTPFLSRISTSNS